MLKMTSVTTSTILRVKRRLEDNPQDAFVLVSKRMKIDEEELSPSLFVFQGTVNNRETSEVSNIVPKTNVSSKFSHTVSDILEKIRKERKDVSTRNRYEIVNCSRGIEEENVKNIDGFDLVDLQKSEDQEVNVKYAYDLYTAAKPDFDVSMLDNIVSIENIENDLTFGSFRDNDRRSSASEGDEDDSNDENNWRNEYPDSDHSSVNEQDMIRAVAKIDIDDDLSSDNGEDDIYNDLPAHLQEDEKRYGAAYAKYKAKVLAEDKKLTDSQPFVHLCEYDEDDGFYYGQEEDTEQFKEQYRNDSSDSPD